MRKHTDLPRSPSIPITLLHLHPIVSPQLTTLHLLPLPPFLPTPFCAATAAAFKPVSPLAAGLMLPTLVWVTIATKLNIDIVALNPNHKAE